MFDRKWKESEPLLGSGVGMPAHAEQHKLIGLSPNHREKGFLWETKSGTSLLLLQSL